MTETTLTLEAFEAHPEYAHLRKAWFVRNRYGNLLVGAKRDDPGMYWPGDDPAVSGQLCADETDDNPGESLDKGWPVPFWIYDEELAMI